jgi:hypothetical protein
MMHVSVHLIYRIHNFSARHILTTDYTYWAFLLRTTLGIELPRSKEKNAFNEVLRHISKWRCVNCLEMEFFRHPYIHPFLRRPLCNACRFHTPKYQFITAMTAKSEPYFLNKDDLIPLKEFSEKSHHYHNAAHTRWFLRADV